jgi:3-oxoacyl-[acyl-carrier protein] reductase
MGEIAYDFAAYRVLVVGGTRGVGLEVAHAFADSGATVCVTGTMMLRELYDADLSRFDYEMVNLARQESIDNLAVSLGEVDIAVVAAGANLPYALPPSERDFIGGAVLSGLLGPGYLARKLRLRLAQSPAPGGGVMVLTGGARRWWEIAQTPDEASKSLRELTSRTAEGWVTLGARFNSVLEPDRPPSFFPRQASSQGRSTAHRSGDLLVRDQPRLQQAVTDATLFLASESAARLNGQVLQLS